MPRKKPRGTGERTARGYRTGQAHLLTQQVGKNKCSTRKRLLSSELYAGIVLTNIQKQAGPDAQYVPKRVYQCNLCHFWHLTSKDDWNKVK